MIANEAQNNVHQKPQSLLITGVSGSGKTETTKHIIDFLCNSSTACHVHNIDSVIKANLILESFGNARTCENHNSSRFCKFVEVYLLLFIFECVKTNIN